MKRRIICTFALVTVGCGGATEPGPTTPPVGTSSALAPPPATPSRPVVDDYSGLKVTDPYRWLEGDDAEVAAWSAAQTKRARAFLDAYPGTAPLRERIAGMKKGKSAEFSYFAKRPNGLFAWKTEPALQQPMLVLLDATADPKSARVVVDPNKIDASGGTSMDFYVPSLDGKLVAVSLSKGGSEAGDVHVFDVATGKDLETIERVNGGTAGGSVAWTDKGTGLFYTRYPRKGERPAEDMQFYQQLWFHQLGKKPETDTYVIGKEFPRIAEIAVSTREDGAYLLMDVANGDGGEHMHWLASAKDAKWAQLTSFADRVESVWFGRDEQLYALSRKGAPKGKVLRTPAAKPSLDKTPETLVPEGDATIRNVMPTTSRLYVAELVGGPSRVRVLDLKGKELGSLALPAVPSVGQLVRLDKDEVMYSVETFIEPMAWYRYAGSGAPAKTALFTTAPYGYADAEVLRETCTSKDGTKVPLSIILKKDAPRDGARPTILNGYGGYAVSIEPSFGDHARVMLDQGGVYAVANLRGGGEFGEAWHEGGMLLKKQNVFDDFVACAQRLVELTLTRKDKLAILGGSNGGLLMGAAMVQHPDLFQAVVSEVGIYDMLRSEAWPNGAFNVTEFGTVKDPAQLKALYAYSPYHHVVDGTAYPAVLFTTGTNDPRVAPWQSRKMTARMQAAGGKAPVLLVTHESGHGIGDSLDQEIANTVDLYAFVFTALGVAYHPPAH